MNKKAFIIFLVVVLALFALGSCSSSQKSADVHNAEASLDWAGVYTGTIPAADGPGINVRMKLDKDNTYELTYEYIDRPPENSFTSTGKFTWDTTGNIIHIEIVDAPSYYKAAENKLIQLDMEGKPITGKLADNYVLTKER
jgi:uncharacterized lipoprotein NlpE involved in copper resistance